MNCGQEKCKTRSNCGNSAECKQQYLCGVIVQTDSKLGGGEQGKDTGTSLMKWFINEVMIRCLV